QRRAPGPARGGETRRSSEHPPERQLAGSSAAHLGGAPDEDQAVTSSARGLLARMPTDVAANIALLVLVDCRLDPRAHPHPPPRPRRRCRGKNMTRDMTPVKTLDMRVVTFVREVTSTASPDRDACWSS